MTNPQEHVAAIRVDLGGPAAVGDERAGAIVLTVTEGEVLIGNAVVRAGETCTISTAMTWS